MAEQDLFAIIVTVLATVALTKAVDDKGQEITPEVNIAMHGLLWYAVIMFFFYYSIGLN
jgi:hypothetical protein